MIIEGSVALDWSHGIDYHRSSGCLWTPKDADPATLKWPALCDWAVYHGPGVTAWQAFRYSLTKTPMIERPGRIMAMWTLINRPIETEYDRLAVLAYAVRCTNLCRSHRGQFATTPRFRTVLDTLNAELKTLWSTQGGGHHG